MTSVLEGGGGLPGGRPGAGCLSGVASRDWTGEGSAPLMWNGETGSAQRHLALARKEVW